MTTVELTTVPDSEWPAFYAAVLREHDRRRLIREAPRRAEELASEYLGARDGAAGGAPEWVRPTGAHDAYPLGYTVTLSGRTWRSLTSANVWMPGGAGVPAGLWEEVTAANAGTVPTDDVTGAGKETPAWDGGGRAYKVGDRVAYEGAVYRVIQAHTSQPGWTPTAVPSLYART